MTYAAFSNLSNVGLVKSFQ